MTNEREELKKAFLDSLTFLPKHDRTIIHLLALHLEGVDPDVDSLIAEVDRVAAKVGDLSSIHIANAVGLVTFPAQHCISIKPIIESNKKWGALMKMEISK